MARIAKKDVTNSRSRSNSPRSGGSGGSSFRNSSEESSFQKALNTAKASFEGVTARDYQFAGIGAVIMLVLVIFFSAIFGVDFSLGRNSVGSTIVSTEAQSGQVALTEAQLRAEVKKITVPVYWVGAQAGALYTLENQANTRIFVRYLPDGKIPPQGEASKRIVGTYILKGAFDSTKQAGTTIANGIGYINDDGAAVYYNSTSPTNVYVAFPNVDAQIEIFDPTKGIAVQLATSKGTLQQIK